MKGVKMSTFLKDLENISVDPEDEWQICDNHMTVKIFGLEKYPLMMFNLDLEKDYPDGWIDTYAIGDPINKNIQRIEFIVTLNTGDVKDDLELFANITNITEGKALYQQILLSGGKEMEEFVAKAANEAHSFNMEHIGVCVDAIEDFLGKRKVKIPTSEAEKEKDEILENAAIIYGPDYDELSAAFKEILAIRDDMI